MRRESVVIAVGILLLVFGLAEGVSAAAGSEVATTSPAPQVEEQDNAPPVGRIGSFRIQSSGQKIVEEDAIRNSIAHPPSQTSPPVPMKRKKPVVIGASTSSSSKNEFRPVTGGEIASDDSLGGTAEKAKTSKGKAAGKKEDSFD